MSGPSNKADVRVVLPPIPAKRYFTIGEVSDLCGVKPHVLRYWEQEFTQLRPMKRRGNRRYYQHHEVLLIRRIRELLYEHGFTISGARNRLAETVQTGRRKEAELTQPIDETIDIRQSDVAAIRVDLLAALDVLRDAVEVALAPQRSAYAALLYFHVSRGVAQPGSALAWGARGRVFESLRPDQWIQWLALKDVSLFRLRECRWEAEDLPTPLWTLIRCDGIRSS